MTLLDLHQRLQAAPTETQVTLAKEIEAAERRGYERARDEAERLAEYYKAEREDFLDALRAMTYTPKG